MKRLVFGILVLLITAFSGPVSAADATAGDVPVFTVGIKPAGPFAYKEGGTWKGLSVDLLERVASRVGFTYEFKEVETITALLSLPEYNSTDIAVGAISMTDEREKVLDFSHPYFVTTPGILVKESNNIFWFIVQRIAAGVAILIAALYTIGFIVARLDPDDSIDNAHKGAWFTLVTFTTTGYGDYVPNNARSKVFASILMITSLFALSAFTGYISSALTVEKLTSEPSTLQDLYNVKVATVAGTTSAKLLETMGIKHETVSTVDVGVDLVEREQVKAFVYDKAMLDYIANKKDNTLQVWSTAQNKEHYAFAFPTDSRLRERFNVALLNIVSSSEWKNVVSKYF